MCFDMSHTNSRVPVKKCNIKAICKKGLTQRHAKGAHTHGPNANMTGGLFSFLFKLKLA